MSSAPRTYRFPARDRTGWLIGLQPVQCVLLGLGVLTSGVLLNIGAPAPIVVGAAATSFVAAFAPFAGRPAYAWVPVVASWVAGRRRGAWTATVPRFAAADARAGCRGWEFAKTRFSQGAEQQ